MKHSAAPSAGVPTAKKKILFATMPLDGHFNPLTSLAVHLQQAGHEVCWYAGPSFKEKLDKMGIACLPFKKAREVNQHNLDSVFPERKKIRNGLKKLHFDLMNLFILRAPEYYADLKEIRESFPFDIAIVDICFTGVPFIREGLKVPVISIGVLPLIEKSKDTAPAGLGLLPAKTAIGKRGYVLLERFLTHVLLKKPNALLQRFMAEEGIVSRNLSAFDVAFEKSSVVLQIGTPGFEYFRSDLSQHVHFIGALLPYSNKKEKELLFLEKVSQYKKVILLTQGTLETDINKILVPGLEAFKQSQYLLIAVTGGQQTAELRKRYPYENCVIEDYIPFDQIMPYVDVFVSNGGYGGVMLSIMNQVPMVVGGKFEGKNEICARVGYFELGINLKTENPAPEQIKGAVEKVLSDEKYQKNTRRLADEFKQYQPLELCSKFVEELTALSQTSPPPAPNTCTISAL